MIECIHLCKAFGAQTVLHDVSLQIQGRGCLLGPSGVGKTTLLRILAGLERPDSGSVHGLSGLRVSYQFQEDRLLPWLTALENVSLVSDEGRAAEILADLGLGAALQKKPRALSGGMRRRVALGRALAAGGDLLLLDEPSKGMDQALQAQIHQVIHHAWRGEYLFTVTHDRQEALTLGDALFMMDDTGWVSACENR